MRSTSIGLLGLVAAVGLGLIAFISQLGWPGVFNQPIPGSPAEAGTVHGAIALTRPAPAVGVSSASHVLPRATVFSAVRRHRSSRETGDAPAIGGSRQLAAAGAPGGETTPSAPAPTPVRESEPQPSVPVGETTSQPTTTVVSTSAPTTPTSPTSGPQTAGSTSDHKTDQDHGKSDEASGESGREHGSPSKPSAPPAPPVPQKPSDPPPPVVTPPSKEQPEAPGYGDGKGWGGSGKSDWHRH